MDVAGVDGCPGGWLVVRVLPSEHLRIVGVSVRPTFPQILGGVTDCAAIAIDIPIGLSDDGRREPDVEARKVLRPLRHNSVFPAPVRAVLAAKNYKEACAISASARPDGRMVSKQTYFLSFKIAEVDRLMSSDPSMQDRVVEIHPEVSFWALNGKKPLSHYKRTPEGELERLELVSTVFKDDLIAISPPPGAARNDFFDACAAAWTAARVAHKGEGRLPEQRLEDSHGLRMQIVY